MDSTIAVGVYGVLCYATRARWAGNWGPRGDEVAVLYRVRGGGVEWSGVEWSGRV